MSVARSSGNRVRNTSTRALPRAGQGKPAISEETDAVTIVVSEETGSISTAVGGRLEKNKDMGSLREFLTENFISSKKKKRL